MKTSEFKKKIEALGFKVREYESAISVYDRVGCIRAVINRLHTETISLNTSRLCLIKLCLEYAETPIEEREEEKKYTVVLPDPERKNADCVLGRTPDNRVVICIKDAGDFDDSNFLTESEIKRNHEYLWQFAKEVKG